MEDKLKKELSVYLEKQLELLYNKKEYTEIIKL